MYCKYCGKQIAENSTFCQYCGGKVDELYVEHSHMAIQEEQQVEENMPVQEVDVSTEKDSDIKVEDNKKSIDNGSIIANEIVGNLKMVGFALIGWIVFMGAFIAFHQKDIKKHPGSSWGESCYDEKFIIGGYGPFDYKEILPKYKRYRYYERNGLYPDGTPDPTYGSMFDTPRYDISDEELEKMAKEEAERNKAEFSRHINDVRRIRYEGDLSEKAIYSAIILLALFIVGRYLIKLTKWVNKNKTV